MSKLRFSRCYCCLKNYNVSQLVDLTCTNNSVVIGDESINFVELILDVCLISVSTDSSKTIYICDECKNQLVYFHIFKRDVKKYSSFAYNLRNLKILERVEHCLTKVNSSLDLQVIIENNSIIISPLTAQKMIVEHHKIPQEAEIVKEEFLEQLPEEDVQETEVLEEYIYETVESDHHEDTNEPEPENQSDKHEEYEIAYLAEEETNEVENSSSRSERQKSRKYKYPINTNDRLTDEEKDWINKQVRECTVEVEGKIIYKCPLCETFLKISGSLKKHLRDTHILKNDNELNVWNNRRAFKDEIKQSKMIVETADGPETIWKCQRCSINRIFRSEPGLKVHIRYSHIRTGRIDAKFIARCKIVIDGDQGPKDAWRCPDCLRVLKSRDGLRNHMKLEHPDTVAEKATSGDEQFMRLPDKDHSENDVLQNLLERKRRTLKNETSANLCVECGIEFVNGTSKKEKSCRIHQECHKILNVVSQYYQLPKCDISKVMFSNNEDLNKYLSSEQMSFEVLPCDGMTAKVSQKLKEPTGTSADDDSWKCGHCGGKYQTEFECNSHVMILHSKKLICPVDHMEFEGNRGISQFNIHMHNKHGEFFPDLVISCTYCSMENFASHFEKLEHMKNCSEKKFECDHCSKKYFTKTDLLRHLKIATGEIKYVCIICSKNCSSTMDLRLHQTSHTNQKAYQCSYPDCNKAFKTPAARSSHMETHGNISYACSLCSASFRQRALLQRHIKKGYCKGNQVKESAKGQVVFEETYEDV